MNHMESHVALPRIRVGSSAIGPCQRSPESTIASSLLRVVISTLFTYTSIIYINHATSSCEVFEVWSDKPGQMWCTYESNEVGPINIWNFERITHISRRAFSCSSVVASQSGVNSLDTFSEEEQMFRETGLWKGYPIQTDL